MRKVGQCIPQNIAAAPRRRNSFRKTLELFQGTLEYKNARPLISCKRTWEASFSTRHLVTFSITQPPTLHQRVPIEAILPLF